MEVICLEEEAFYKLIEVVVARILAKYKVQEDRWISSSEVMKILRIKSKTTLQRLRDESKIRFSQPDGKIILYGSFLDLQVPGQKCKRYLLSK